MLKNDISEGKGMEEDNWKAFNWMGQWSSRLHKVRSSKNGRRRKREERKEEMTSSSG